MTYAHEVYCVNCSNFVAGSMECKKITTVSLVTGKTLYTDAHLARNTKCGPQGKYFAPLELEAAELDDLSTIPFGK